MAEALTESMNILFIKRFYELHLIEFDNWVHVGAHITNFSTVLPSTFANSLMGVEIPQMSENKQLKIASTEKL